MGAQAKKPGGAGSALISARRSALVRFAKFWIIGAWCARFGRTAPSRRGRKGTSTCEAKVRNSESHTSAVLCWISSSARAVSGAQT